MKQRKKKTAPHLRLSSLLQTACALIWCALLIQGRAQASPGDLDPTFSGDGKFFRSIYGQSVARAVALQPDGKIVLAGFVRTGSTLSSLDFAVLRLNANGTMDTTFSDDGWLNTDFAGANDDAYAVTVQPDGKILVGGYANSGGLAQFAMARYLPNGNLDPEFGTAGKVILAFGTGTHDYIRDMAVLPDGRILVAGYTATNFENARSALARFHTDGALDTTFGTSGKFSAGGWRTEGRALAVQTDGKILVGGHLRGPSSQSFALMRHLANGSLDPTFGSGGYVYTGFSGSSQVEGMDLVLQPDGKPVMCGFATSPTRFAIVRYQSNGLLDTSFNGSGKLTHVFENTLGNVAFGIGLQSTGKIVAAGWAATGSPVVVPDFALARYTTDGVLDSTFSGDGKVTTAMSSSTEDYAQALVIQPDGRIVVAGYVGTTSPGGFAQIAVARYDGSEAPLVHGEIRVFGPDGSELQQGASVTWPDPVAVNAELSRPFSILSDGTGTLENIAVNVIPVQGSGFAVDASSVPMSLAPSGLAGFSVSLNPPAAGAVEALLRITSNDPDDGSFDVTLVGEGAEAIEVFGSALGTAGLTGDDALPEATPFGDDVPNLLKYAFNMNLAGPDSSTMATGGVSGLPTHALDESGPETVWKVEFVRRKGSGLIYTPIKSTDLDVFEPMTGTTTATDIDEKWERVVVTEPCDPAVTPKCFSRVMVELP